MTIMYFGGTGDKWCLRHNNPLKVRNSSVMHDKAHQFPPYYGANAADSSYICALFSKHQLVDQANDLCGRYLCA